MKIFSFLSLFSHSFVRRRNLSDNYQHLFAEIPTDFSPSNKEFRLSSTIATEDGLWYEKVSQDELQLKRVLNTQSGLLIAMFEILAPHLTELQTKVIQIMKENPDNTQWENAHLLNAKNRPTYNYTQSDILHTLKGHKAYWVNGKRIPADIGGLKAKIKRYCLTNENFRSIILKMFEIDDSNKYIKITRSFFKTYEDYLDWLYEPIDQLTSLKAYDVDEIKLEIIKALNSRPQEKIIPKIINKNHFLSLKQYRQRDITIIYNAYKDEIIEKITK